MNSKLLIAGTIAAMTISTSVAETCAAGAEKCENGNYYCCKGLTILIENAADVNCAGDQCNADDFLVSQGNTNAPCCTAALTCQNDGKKAITKPCKLDYDSTTLCATGKFVYYDDNYDNTCNEEAEIEHCDSNVKEIVFIFYHFFLIKEFVYSTHMTLLTI